MKILEKINTYKLEITVFTSGAVVMILEIVGSRVLAPGLGNSTFVWSSLIGVILGAMSLGYWLGGRLSDKKATYNKLSDLLLLAGISVLILNIIKSPVLNFFSLTLNVRTASVMVGIVLFAPAGTILGMVSPFAIRLKLDSIKNSGATIGALYALSTLGSIVGTFLAGFVLISYFGTSKIIFLLSIILILLSIFVYPRRLLKSKILLILFLVLTIYVYGLIQKDDVAKGHIDLDTAYSRILIYNTIYEERPVRIMSMDKISMSGMFLDGNDLVFDYTKGYNLAEHFNNNIYSALMIGGAAYSYPKEFLTRYPNATIDVVEIDPEVTELAKKYFRLKDNPNLEIYHEDGRIFLNKNKKQYDVIYGDAYTSIFTIPFQLATKEAAQLMYDSLSDDGVVIVNIISTGTGPKSGLFASEYFTFKEVFPQVFAFQVEDKELSSVQNLMLVASKKNSHIDLNSPNAELAYYLNLYIPNDLISEDGIVFTDEYAPIEYFTSKLL